MNQNQSNTAHWVLGIALLLIGVFVIIALVLVNSQAATSQVTINNSAPAFDTRFISTNPNGGVNDFGGGVNLLPGGNKTININGKVSDANGNADITGVSVYVRRSGIASTSCDSVGEVDPNFCYVVESCTLSNPNFNQKDYNCAVNLEYYADSTSPSGEFPAENWVLDMAVTDGTATTTDNTGNFEVNNLVALNIPGAINWGTLALNTQTTNANNNEMVITQNGNTPADVEVSGTNLTCDGSGNIPVNNVKWALTDVGATDGSAVALSGTNADTNLAVGRRSGAEVTKTLYWNISIPAGGVLGTCTGTVNISAIAS